MIQNNIENEVKYHRSLDPNDTACSRDCFMSLGSQASSNTAHHLANYIAVMVHDISDRSRRPSNKLVQAVEAILADLFMVANGSYDRYLYRPRGSADFTGQRIGFRPCTNALNGMVELDLLHWTPGLWLGSQQRGEGNTARYQGKPNLFELALRFGITPANWRSHFAPAPRSARMPHPVIVRGKRQFWDKEDKGQCLPLIKTHPGYIAAAAQVNRINAYMAPQLLTGCNHDGFIRIFNYGDQQGFAYNMGGRLYSKASGVSYQNMGKHHRHDMRINGEPVVELDIRASFLTILYAQHGMAPDPSVDPYSFGPMPREVIKAWIAMTLGYDRFHSKWSDETVNKMIEDEGINLRQEYNIADVRASVINEHPMLHEWPCSTARWHDLQYLESSAIIDAVEALGLHHDITGLPLHDALLVQRSNIDTASEVLTDTFRNRIGVAPVLKLKDHWPKKRQ